MAYTNAWDETSPLGSALVSTVDDIIRQLKLDLRERLSAGSSDLNAGRLALVSVAATSGSPNLLKVTGPAHTGLTASAEAADVLFDLARTVTFLTGTLAAQRAVKITPPTYAFATASTLTKAATLAITGAPAAGANATITDAYALLVEAGKSRFEGAVEFGTLLNVIVGAIVSSAVVGTSPLVVNHDPTGTITSKILELQEKDAVRFSFFASEHLDGAPFNLDDFDGGTDVGRFVTLGRNSNASTPAPGFLKFVDKSGTARYIWFDSSGNLRAGTAAPTNTDNGGSVVPLVSSSLIGGGAPQQSAGTYYTSLNGNVPAGTDTVFMKVAKAGTIRNLYVQNGTYMSYSVRKNTVDTDLAVAAGVSSDTTHSFSVVPGDRLSIKITISQDVATPSWGVQFDAEVGV